MENKTNTQATISTGVGGGLAVIVVMLFFKEFSGTEAAALTMGFTSVFAYAARYLPKPKG